jgi:hypothetical protein
MSGDLGPHLDLRMAANQAVRQPKKRKEREVTHGSACKHEYYHRF